MIKTIIPEDSPSHKCSQLLTNLNIDIFLFFPLAFIIDLFYFKAHRSSSTVLFKTLTFYFFFFRHFSIIFTFPFWHKTDLSFKTYKQIKRFQETRFTRLLSYAISLFQLVDMIYMCNTWINLCTAFYTIRGRIIFKHKPF